MQTLMKTILELSQTLLKQAQQADWQAFEQTQAERALLVERATRLPVESADSQVVTELIRQIQQLDTEIETLAKQQQTELLQARQRLRRSSKAINAYGDV